MKEAGDILLIDRNSNFHSVISNVLTNKMESYPNDEYDLLDKLRNSINLVNHLLLLSITLALSWKCFQMKFTKTAFHAFFCTLGFVFLFAEGTMARYNANIFTKDLNITAKLRLHVLLQFCGGLFGCIGTIQKSLPKKKHFQTLHGQFGIAACIFFIINLLIGTLGMFSNTYRALFTNDFHRFLHTLIGLSTFLIGMIAQYYGYETGFMKRNFKNINLYKFITIIIIILTIVGPLQLLLWRFMKLFN